MTGADPLLDVAFMEIALEEARLAAGEGEVPVGAVVASGSRLLGRGHNAIERLKDATAHAEILAIGAASQALGTWRLEGCTLYCTLEPCPMCAGALVQARIARVVWAAPDLRLGACGTHWNIPQDNTVGRDISVERGPLEEESASLLRGFFGDLRRGERPRSSLRPKDAPTEDG